MPIEWFTGILIVLTIIIIPVLRIRSKGLHSAPTRERYTDLNGLPTDTDAILRQLSMGKKIQAIKLYRVQTGVGLKEAKQAVEAMQQEKLQALVSETAATYTGDDAIQSMLIAGNKINAIKLYRQRTGVGLKEAKAAIDNMILETKAAIIEKSSQTEHGQINPDELQRLILAGQKIQAIKYYREVTGMGLKEAKDAVDWLAAQMQQNI
jgi:ribosomal protein L7/L12